jgi:predicted transcriptional regulator
MKRRPRSEARVTLPTNGELSILEVLWEAGEGTVNDVVARLPSKPRANYKTVQSLLRIMERKGFVRHKERGRAFVFAPRMTRDETGGAAAKRLLDRNFRGSFAALLVNLLDGDHVEKQELDELEELIRRYREQEAKDESVK